MSKKPMHNDGERAQWVQNDEGLSNAWQQNIRAGGMSLGAFVRIDRAEIDAVIDNVTSGAKPAHYLVDGPITTKETV